MRIIKYPLLIILIFINISVVTVVDKPAAINLPEDNLIYDPTQTNIDLDRALTVINELSSPAYQGRLPGSVGNSKAVDYVINQFREIGLTPPTNGSEYLQTFTQQVIVTEKAPILKTLTKNGDFFAEYYFMTDFVARYNWAKTRINGEVQAPLVYIQDPSQLNRSNRDLNGNILLLDFSLVEYFQNDRPEDADGLIQKILSLDNNIQAVIINYDTRRDGYYHISASLNRFFMQGGEYANEIGPMILFCSDFAFPNLRNAASRGDLVNISMNYELSECESANVIGVIEGTSSKTNNEYIIVGAHLDHIGHNGNGTYFPGALDNASGVAALLETARALKAMPNPPHKTIIFIAFNGEEENLLGSSYYASNPFYPLNNAVMINYDVVGSANSTVLDIAGYNTNPSQFQKMMKWYADSLGINCQLSSISSSDHVPFAARGVPSVMLVNVEAEPRIHTIQDIAKKTIDMQVFAKAIEVAVYYIKQQGY